MMTMNKITKEEAFAKHSFGEAEAHWLKTAIHIDWENLEDTFSQLLSDLLGRDIRAESERQEYYYWKIGFRGESILTEDELNTLFDAVNLDLDEREKMRGEPGYDYDYPGYEVGELPEELCCQLMNELLPFTLSVTRADDEGVWFIS